MARDITKHEMEQLMWILDEYHEDLNQHGPRESAEDAWHGISHAYYEARDELGTQDPGNDRAYVRALAMECIGYLIDIPEDDDEKR